MISGIDLSDHGCSIIKGGEIQKKGFALLPGAVSFASAEKKRGCLPTL
jgi:hypothetical protein